MSSKYINKFYFLVISGLLLFDFALKSNQEESFPFRKNPELSWNQFEKNFRNTYQGLDIPKIVRTDLALLLQGSPARYVADDENVPAELTDDIAFEAMITELKDKTGNENLIQSLQSLKGAKPPFIAINLKQNRFLCWQELAYVLLHETGHHYYDKNGLHHKSHSNAQKKADLFSCGTIALATIYNSYLISQKKWSKKAIAAQSIFMLLYATSVVHSLFKDILAVRPEEFIADDFANQHATQEVLQAGKDMFIIEHSLELLCLNDPTLSQIIQKPKDATDKFISNIIRFFASLSWIDYSHPSDYQRVKLIEQALKNRFVHQ